MRKNNRIDTLINTVLRVKFVGSGAEHDEARGVIPRHSEYYVVTDRVDMFHPEVCSHHQNIDMTESK